MAAIYTDIDLRHIQFQHGDALWDSMMPTKGKTKPYVAVFYDYEDRPGAYCLYRSKELANQTPGPWQQVEVEQLQKDAEVDMQNGQRLISGVGSGMDSYSIQDGYNKFSLVRLHQ